MAALSERKIQIVRSLVESAPDRVVGGLQAALAQTGPESALAGVRRLVDAEARERRARNIVLQPLAPMCVGDGASPHALTFPARVLPLIWRGLQAIDAPGVQAARMALHEYLPEEPAPEEFDALTRRAAAALRAAQLPEFRQAMELSEAARPNGAHLLATCAEIAPVVRTATMRLSEWLARFDEASGAAARLAYKDAAAICDDAGPVFFEMLAAQMASPWMVLRVISEVMDKPTERYLADSEMAIFGERVLGAIDDSLKAIAKIDLDGGPQTGRAMGRTVELVTHQLTEVESCVTLTRETGWGLRLSKQRQGLANVVEGRLKDAEKYVRDALPTQTARIARIRREVPRLSNAPDPRTVGRALTLLHFVHEIRTSANYGGFASARGKLVEKLGPEIDHYVEEVLDLLKTGDAESEEHAFAYLEAAAEFNGLIQGDKAADLVRRRAYAAAHPELAFAAGA